MDISYSLLDKLFGQEASFDDEAEMTEQHWYYAFSFFQAERLTQTEVLMLLARADILPYDVSTVIDLKRYITRIGTAKTLCECVYLINSARQAECFIELLDRVGYQKSCLTSKLLAAFFILIRCIFALLA
ncbi:hypothetical protein EV210_12328 [Anaerospora hongkongensis]|uniref:Uncharacterized protein n=1 Tax=Anaerospora hongkongensis TaxID=244830 RepID=A0A4R1PP72_9FIRM|nr:hypothetical protein [Anaerospora hongkongensis]TCL32208.1 hypothetical protein EV210_12328 [Anaerospora hongkongensis]